MESPSLNRTFAVLEYLWKTTDESHTVTLVDISQYLSQLGFHVKDSRTIRGDIAQLLAFGIDIVVVRKVQNHYFIGSRFFETPEVKMLIDAVQCAKFISEKKSRAMIEKLAAFVGPEQAGLFKRELYVDRRLRTNNEAIYRIVDWIQTAIAQDRKISFQYSEYAPDRTKRLRHNGMRYTFSPYCMIWNYDSYYTVGYSDKHQKIVKYRVDRMENLEVSGEAQTSRPADFDVAEYFSQEFSMLDGSECVVELICENALMNSIVDRFGEEAETEILDDEHFKLRATVDLSSNFYGWVFASGGKMRIAGPEEAIAGFQAMLRCFSG